MPILHNNKGIAFAVSIALVLLLSITAIVFLVSAYNSVTINESLARRARAITRAEAGINYAFWKIRINEDDSGDPMSDYFPGTCTLTPPITIPTGWSIQVSVEDNGLDPKTVKSTVNYQKSTVF
ncbi:MAG: hypothetical protein KKH08_01670 [Candidatus Omnitrophica bacterium]|nr:hypothetical protein [Candidatus Omnitrophota bacterium]